jgi:hypothetical protein
LEGRFLERRSLERRFLERFAATTFAAILGQRSKPVQDLRAIWEPDGSETMRSLVCGCG